MICLLIAEQSALRVARRKKVLGIESARDKFVHESVCGWGDEGVFVVFYSTLLTFLSFCFKTMGNKESDLQTKKLIKYFLLYINAHVSNDQH